MWNSILAVAAGTLADFLCYCASVILARWLAYSLPPSPGLFGLLMYLSWISGSIAGGAVTALVARRRKLRHTVVTGAVMMVMYMILASGSGRGLAGDDMQYFLLLTPCSLMGGWVITRLAAAKQADGTAVHEFGRPGAFNSVLSVAAGTVTDHYGSSLSYQVFRILFGHLSGPVLFVANMGGWGMDLLGGFVTGSVARRNKVRHATVTGVVMVLLSVLTFRGLPRCWNALLFFALTLPGEILGGVLAARIKPQTPEPPGEPHSFAPPIASPF